MAFDAVCLRFACPAVFRGEGRGHKRPKQHNRTRPRHAKDEKTKHEATRKHRHLAGFSSSSVSCLAGPGPRQTAAETAAETRSFKDRSGFFFGHFSFCFVFSFAAPCPCFSSFLFFWRGARGAQNEEKNATNARNEKSQSLQKSSISEDFFARRNRRKRPKKFEVADASVFRGAGAEKRQNRWAGAVTPRVFLFPPLPRGGAPEAIPPELPFPPFFGESSLLRGGGA